MDGQFGVAIRSAVRRTGECGLRWGGHRQRQHPPERMDETALKFRPMLDALGITDDVEIS